MESITFTPGDFQELKQMFIESQRILRDQASTLASSKIGMLSLKQVSELTGYKQSFIRSRKEEIGFHTVGKDLKFKPSDLDKWINKYYRGPK